MQSPSAPHTVGARPSARGFPGKAPRDQGRSYDSAQQTNKAGIAPGLVRWVPLSQRYMKPSADAGLQAIAAW
ncbi:hypothetical protein XPR_2102 [Xanthomonas arboricola pv. pruni MAFF 301420]|uniref:Uncharacterized protein n=1 Tax=Xanthomonas arboricola pv. pruni MAFF 301420 TaxID=1418095 RepID=W4SGI2_9XANT|nr:hypothetical protein XPR_2102 [Xanthomonas arboricola pv. pruni MAFF 301420]GAE60635.1 hypothetical protein XPN_2541 [Xanthomonas arboricola pv. pruni MAFF 301427]